MKHRAVLISSLLLGMVLVFSNCKKNDDIDFGLDTKVTMRINGNEWQADSVVALKAGSRSFFTVLKIPETFTFNMPSTDKGTYDVVSDTLLITYVSEPEDTLGLYSAYEGQIVVTEITDGGKKFNGTFRFDARNLKGQVLYATEGELRNIPIPQ